MNSICHEHLNTSIMTRSSPVFVPKMALRILDALQNPRMLA
ncbi:hypothetical protein FOTG_19235 [Fusarium oxysporum f. sp. vasinfectum 25433]|uniref:Uncharacterized protein n=1 Tax=Fusarium oxysporum f. sp. vasinfectum 25433 TaxID=1089449 RepID=X0KF88_FUSOX|nr:hypothetical protein FOTG_19235 [Fusarium oxysporum f. sp. vasinfectum 25433]